MTLEQEFHAWVIANHPAGKFLKEDAKSHEVIPAVFSAFKAGRESAEFPVKELTAQRLAGYNQCMSKYKKHIYAALKIEKSAELTEDLSMGVYMIPMITAWTKDKSKKLPVLDAIIKEL